MQVYVWAQLCACADDNWQTSSALQDRVKQQQAILTCWPPQSQLVERPAQ